MSIWQRLFKPTSREPTAVRRPDALPDSAGGATSPPAADDARWHLLLCSFPTVEVCDRALPTLKAFVTRRSEDRGYFERHTHEGFEMQARLGRLTNAFGGSVVQGTRDGGPALLSLIGGEVLREQVSAFPRGQSFELISDAPLPELERLMSSFVNDHGGVGIVA